MTIQSARPFHYAAFTLITIFYASKKTSNQIASLIHLRFNPRTCLKVQK